MGPHLATRGHALFAISYRLAKRGTKAFPEAVRDVVAAVRFLRGNAGRFGIDPGRIGLFGASAGAHLAALTALASRLPQFAEGYRNDPCADVDAGVKALIGVYGVYDVGAMWDYYRAFSPLDNNIENFLGTSPMQDRRLYFDASPISYATVASNQLAVLLACGTEDDLVDRRANTDAFLRALKLAGFFARTVVVQGAGHYWLGDPLEDAGSHSGFFAPHLMRFLADKL